MNNLQPHTVYAQGCKRRPPTRHGLVLVLVLVVIAMLSLAGYAFNELMFSANRASRLSGQQAQAAYLVESGVAALKYDLATAGNNHSGSSDPMLARKRYGGVRVFEDDRYGRTGRFSIVTPMPSEEAPVVRFALANESAKLNLSALVAWDKEKPGVARDALMKLPRMTNEVADSLLDWIDADNQPREFGSEVDYYAGLDPPYQPRNGPVEAMEALLLVRGVSRRLLLGSDHNRNGVLEPIEIDKADQAAGTGSTSVDPSSGASMAHQGWSAWLTLRSAESNLDPGREPKIDLNDADLRGLHARLLKHFDQGVADFVILYRQFGPSTATSAVLESTGAIDWTRQPNHRFVTELDLAGSRVSAVFAGKKEAVVLKSPLGAKTAELNQWLPKWLDYVTINPSPVIAGRVNINLASREVLEAIPGLDLADIDAILSRRDAKSQNSAGSRRHAAWLASEGVLGLDKMKLLMKFVTTGGDVHRGQVVGHFDDGGYQARVELVLDASVRPPRIVQWRDLRHLGRAYPDRLLNGAAGTEGLTARR